MNNSFFQESSEIEAICSKLQPCEWKEAITAWRAKTVNSQSRDEIIEGFKESATEIINKRIERELEMIRESEEPPQVCLFNDGDIQKRLEQLKGFSN